MKILKQAPYSFLFRFFLLFGIWKSSFFFIWRSEKLLTIYNEFSIAVIQVLLQLSSAFLSILQYPVDIIKETRIVKIAGTSGVTVGEPCIGFGLMALVIGLILSTSLSAIKKTKYMILGVFIVNCLNVLRISALAILVQFDPYLWELNHKFIFTIIVYTIIFLLWMYTNRSVESKAV